MAGVTPLVDAHRAHRARAVPVGSFARREAALLLPNLAAKGLLAKVAELELVEDAADLDAQSSLFVRTDFRLTHVELKTLSQSAPVRSRINGPWIQDLGGSHSHEIKPDP